MNILVITPFYKHDRNIASVRWTNISARLAKRHNVIVVTQPHDDMDMTMSIEKDEVNILVARINQKTAYEKFAVKHMGAATGDDWQTSSNSDKDTANNNSESMVRKIKNRALFASMKQKARDYAKVIQKKVIPADTKIDVVISSACPFIEMLFGYELKKRLNCKWICDFRDLPYTNEHKHDAIIMKKLMKKSLSVADAITTIAKKGKEYLEKEIINSPQKIHIITNGFSLADAREPKFINDGILHIVHTGSLYGGTRKADLFFKATQMARKKNPGFSYILECAGGNNESLIETAKKYGEEASVYNRGFIARQDALNMQSNADMLLALIFKTVGSFSAKLFEYTLNKKPIICISCGKGDVSEETLYVQELNLGITAEEVSEECDIKTLCEYLLKQYDLKKQSLPLIFNPQEDLISEFDHDRIVKKIESLCESI